MKSKQIILLIIIIAALAGAGVFAYLSMTASQGTPAVPGGLDTTQAQNNILPHGSELNFDKINQFNEVGRTFQYPATTPEDTGLTLNEIISQ